MFYRAEHACQKIKKRIVFYELKNLWYRQYPAIRKPKLAKQNNVHFWEKTKTSVNEIFFAISVRDMGLFTRKSFRTAF